MISQDHIGRSFIMKQATKDDTSRVGQLLVNTAKWFKQRGSLQWQDLLRGIDTHGTEEAIQRGDVFICLSKEELAGVVILLQSPSEWDKNLWQLPEEDPNESIYLHRLAINRKYAHHQLGREIVNWSQKHTQFEGKKKLRLDCIAQNEFLNRFYQEAGFTYQGAHEGYSLYEYDFVYKK